MFSLPVSFTDLKQALAEYRTLICVGTKANLSAPAFAQALPPQSQALWPQLLDTLAANNSDGDAQSTWLPHDDGTLVKLIVIALPTELSRNNTASGAIALADLLKGKITPATTTSLLVAISNPDHHLSLCTAIAKSLPPLFNQKSNSGTDEGHLSVAFVPLGDTPQPDLQRCLHLTEGIRTCASLVDMPPNLLDTDHFVDILVRWATQLGCQLEVVRGEDLQRRAFGGIWHVGRTAPKGPALVRLSYTPVNANTTCAWIGKGIVYDTGGLSLKEKSTMPSMKGDMAGAAAVLGALIAAVKCRVPVTIHAFFCLAENAIGPQALKPDDIITLFSGKTVEINNTDAEGRLVLADGLAYATQVFNPDLAIDIATLTGAQLVATGKRHAGILANSAALEARAVQAGLHTGDLVFPMLYCPELLRSEFKSKVADMKNSVKDRMNAQSSCAGHFIGEHLGTYQGQWLHVDIAGPAWAEDRGTGFGVALLFDLLFNH